MHIDSRLLPASLALLALVASSNPTCAAEPANPVVLRIATFGDSRADAKDKHLDGQDRRWLQNTAVLTRLSDEIAASHAQLFVFNGDMVMGYTDDAAQLDREYAYWRGMMAGLMAHGTYVLPVPGNHEMQMPTRQPDGSKEKLAQPWLADAWRANTADLLIDAARWQRTVGLPLQGWDPANSPAPGSDGISTSQQGLSYSLDAGLAHIAVINTDPVGHDSGVPVQWLARDFAAARERGAKRFFVFGHKMAYQYDFARPDAAAKVEKETGLEVRAAERDAFWDLVEAYGATYFCGHEHIFHASQPRVGQGGRAWQVIVGSGGSPFAAAPGTSDKPSDRMYAWAEVAVHADGATDVVIHGFDEHMGPSQVIERWSMPAR
ncbi:MAG: metallophosphoesterase [Alphaproteobacteria bacterium]|nr:metallophosphoesterase [Alphaproteobacteria bacterium]